MDNMIQCISKRCLSVGLVVLIAACGSSEDNPAKVKVEVTTITVAIPEVVTQEDIEQSADLSMDDIEVASGFIFSTQRMVTVDLRFSKIQDMAQIAIYSELEPSSQTPGSLLEQGQIQNSAQYRGMLAVASTVDTLIVVPNDNLSAAVAILIDQNDRVHYIFEEQ